MVRIKKELALYNNGKYFKKKKKKKPKKGNRKKKSKGLDVNKYREYLKSKEWSEIRNDIYQIRGKKCECCGSVNDLHVHHLHYKNIFKEEPEDLVLLCADCHNEEHGYKKRG